MKKPITYTGIIRMNDPEKSKSIFSHLKDRFIPKKEEVIESKEIVVRDMSSTEIKVKIVEVNPFTLHDLKDIQEAIDEQVRKFKLVSDDSHFGRRFEDSNTILRLIELLDKIKHIRSKQFDSECQELIGRT